MTSLAMIPLAYVERQQLKIQPMVGIATVVAQLPMGLGIRSSCLHFHQPSLSPSLSERAC